LACFGMRYCGCTGVDRPGGNGTAEVLSTHG
jgi:hypothetical protein